MLRGLATTNYFADDLQEAKRWYTEVLGVEAYFAYPKDNPAYVEFRIGDYEDELGLIDRRFAPHEATERPAGMIQYWHVTDLEAALERLVSLGATVHEPITPRGDSGFVTASVIDPFGNILGIMYNPHYVDILDKLGVPAAG
jgi:predicted enzyme related to lactoylglutathione lyase